MKYNFFEARKLKLFEERLSEIYSCSHRQVVKMCSHRFEPCLRLDRKFQAKTLDNIKYQGNLNEIPWAPYSYYFSGKKKDLVSLDSYQNHEFYLQNASSLLPPIILDPQKNDRVLDACAAPGGKALYTLKLSNYECELTCNDSHHGRYVELMANMYNYLGENNFVTYTNLRAELLCEKFSMNSFDKILLDAQCSGEGMINLEDDHALKYWSEIRIQKFSRLQKDMLLSCFKLLKPGGILVYSTCTYAPEENEEVIDFLLKKDSSAKILPIDLSFLPNSMNGLKSFGKRKYNESVQNSKRIIPSDQMEGFFVAKITKDEIPREGIEPS